MEEADEIKEGEEEDDDAPLNACLVWRFEQAASANLPRIVIDLRVPAMFETYWVYNDRDWEHSADTNPGMLEWEAAHPTFKRRVDMDASVGGPWFKDHKIHAIKSKLNAADWAEEWRAEYPNLSMNMSALPVMYLEGGKVQASSAGKQPAQKKQKRASQR
jgi:hypothetical protein